MHRAMAIPLFLYDVIRMSVTLWDQEIPDFFSMVSTAVPNPKDLSAAMMAKATKIPAGIPMKLVDPTDSHTRKKMQQFRNTAMRSLGISTLVSNLETIRGTAMSSATVMMTFVISTTCPRVSQMMKGIHSRDRTYTVMVPLAACSMSPLRM